MTRFNPAKQHQSAINWSVIAYQTADNDKAAQTLVIGLVIGVAIAGTSPLLGAAIGTYFVIKGIQKASNADKNKKYIRSSGCVAHVLEGGNFRAYLDQNGEAQVLAELQYAERENLAFSEEAMDFYEEKGTQTATLQQAPTQKIYNFQIDIVGEMTNRIQNIFGVGQGGTGKGMLLANACRAVKAKHPGKKIFLINGKDDPKEHSYFTSIVDIEKRLHCETAKPQTVAAWFEASIAEYDNFAAHNNGALLVIDEGTIIGRKLKDAKSNALDDKIIGITSCGGSTGKNIWVFVQTPFAGGSGSTLSAISQMIIIVLVRGDAIGVLEQWKRSALFSKFNKSEVTELANNSDCNRAVYWGGSANWYSMPKLANHSAYDRDTETYIKDVLTPSEQLEKMFDVCESPTKIQDIDSRLLDYIIDKIASSNDYISFEGIRSHVRRNLPELAKTELIETALTNLIESEIIEGNREVGYRST